MIRVGNRKSIPIPVLSLELDTCEKYKFYSAYQFLCVSIYLFIFKCRKEAVKMYLSLNHSKTLIRPVIRQVNLE